MAKLLGEGLAERVVRRWTERNTVEVSPEALAELVALIDEALAAQHREMLLLAERQRKAEGKQ